MLLDSNIIIYAAMPDYPKLREFIAKHQSHVTLLAEVLLTK